MVQGGIEVMNVMSWQISTVSVSVSLLLPILRSTFVCCFLEEGERKNGEGGKKEMTGPFLSDLALGGMLSRVRQKVCAALKILCSCT